MPWFLGLSGGLLFVVAPFAAVPVFGFLKAIGSAHFGNKDDSLRGLPIFFWGLSSGNLDALLRESFFPLSVGFVFWFDVAHQSSLRFLILEFSRFSKLGYC